MAKFNSGCGCLIADTAGLANQFGEGEVQVVADVFVLLFLVDEFVCKKVQRIRHILSYQPRCYLLFRYIIINNLNEFEEIKEFGDNRKIKGYKFYNCKQFRETY